MTKRQQDIMKALELLTSISNGDLKYHTSLGMPGKYESMAIKVSNSMYLQRLELNKLGSIKQSLVKRVLLERWGL